MTGAVEAPHADPAAAAAVLVAGIPRSGTTWVGHVLGLAGGTPLLHEPDNEKLTVAALDAKAELGRFPVLAVGESAPSYERLWRLAMAGQPLESSTARQRLAARVWRGVPADEREAVLTGTRSVRVRAASALAGSLPAPATSTAVVVKTVHAPLALEWLTDRFPATRVVLVLRHPANVLASWLEMGLPDRDRSLDQLPTVRRRYLDRWGATAPAVDADPVARAAWQVAMLTAVLVELGARHPRWLVVRHEELCVDPPTRFESLARRAGLGWAPAAERFLRESDRPGDGFAVQRLAAAQPDRWRSRLSASGVRLLADATGQFPGLDSWHEDLVAILPAKSTPRQG